MAERYLTDRTRQTLLMAPPNQEPVPVGFLLTESSLRLQQRCACLLEVDHVLYKPEVGKPALDKIQHPNWFYK